MKRKIMVEGKAWIKAKHHGVFVDANGIEYVQLYGPILKWVVRLSTLIQWLLWKIGIAIHNSVKGECTPDFNCCSSVGRSAFIRIGSDSL